LHLEIPIIFNHAALGDQITVPSMEGKLSYKVPAGTQPGTVFRLKGKGLPSPRGGSKGDLYVKVILEVPTKLSAKQKKAIEDMGKEVTADSYHKKNKFAETIKELFK
jgi:molecular chaperone DnaJ